MCLLSVAACGVSMCAGVLIYLRKKWEGLWVPLLVMGMLGSSSFLSKLMESSGLSSWLLSRNVILADNLNPEDLAVG